jgi:type IV secretion system protein VirB7
MTRFFPLLAMAAVLGGCASLTYPLPKCDGYSRRPLNRSMWEWEDERNLKSSRSETRSSISATPYAEQPQEPAAFAHLDIGGSHRRCAG